MTLQSLDQEFIGRIWSLPPRKTARFQSCFRPASKHRRAIRAAYNAYSRKAAAIGLTQLQIEIAWGDLIGRMNQEATRHD